MKRFSSLFLVIASSAAALQAAEAQSATNARGAAAIVGGVVSVSRDSAGSVAIRVAAQDQPIPVVRQGEHESAPWLDDMGGPANPGRILLSTGLPGIAMRAEDKNSFQYSEKIYIVPPSGGTAAVGQVFLAFARADAIGLDAQVLIPTGILRVEQAGTAGEAAVARIVKQFGAIQAEDALMPFIPLSEPRTGTLAAVNNGVSSRVIWVSDGRVLPGVQSVAILDAGVDAGVMLGDIFTLLRPRTLHRDGTWLPEKEIARARVIKVTPRGATVMVVDQTEPRITVGTAARLTARMP
jgi:hypothetical protein